MSYLLQFSVRAELGPGLGNKTHPGVNGSPCARPLLLGVSRARGGNLSSPLPSAPRGVGGFFRTRRLIGSKFNIVRYLVFLNCSRNSSTESNASHLEVAIYLSEINKIFTLLLGLGKGSARDSSRCTGPSENSKFQGILNFLCHHHWYFLWNWLNILFLSISCLGWLIFLSTHESTSRKSCSRLAVLKFSSQPEGSGLLIIWWILIVLQPGEQTTDGPALAFSIIPSVPFRNSRGSYF